MGSDQKLKVNVINKWPLFHSGCSLAQSLRFSKAALVIQKTYRMVVVRQLFLMIRQATVTIQAFTRGALARRAYRQVSASPAAPKFLIVSFSDEV